MKHTVNTGNDWHTSIKVEFDLDTVKPAYDEKFQEYKKNMKMEGFRKGMVPSGLIKKMYGTSIEQDAFHPFIQEAWKEIFADESKYDLIEEPRVEEFNFDPKSGLTFTVGFDVRPVFEISGLEDVEVEKHVFEITDADKAAMLEDLRNRAAMIHTVDGEAEMGHIIICDLQQLDESGVVMVGRNFDDQQIMLAEEETELTPQLLGKKAGDEVKVALKETHKSEDSEEEHVHEHHYLVKVKEVKERKLPKLDDEFAKDMGKDTLAELEETVQKELDHQAGVATKNQYENAMIDAVVDKVGIEAPRSMVNNYVSALVEDFKAQRKESNSKEPFNEDRVREYYKGAGERNVKWLLIHDNIISKNDIKVTDEEVDARIDELTKDHPDSTEQFKKDEGQRKNIQNVMMDEKVFEYLEKTIKLQEIKKPWRVDPNEVEGEDVADSTEE